MIYNRKLSSLIALLILISLTLTAVVPNRVSGEVKPITEVQEKLEGITEEEKAVLEILFTLEQEMEEMEREESAITKDIEALQIEIDDMEELLKERQKNYDDQLDILKKVLVGYQRKGPASYLDTLLSAEDLRTFLESINMIKDLTRNVGKLLDSLEEGKKKLAEERDRLSEKAALLADKKEELQEALMKKLELKTKQEAYLATLKEKSEQYQEQLSNLKQMWEDSKLQFSNIVENFSQIIGEGNISLSDLNLSANLFEIKGAIYEETFNEILREHSDLPGLLFHFYKDRVEIEIPEKHLVLIGTFIIAEDKVLKLEVEKGSFYEMPLENESIEELFIDGYLLIDFKELAGDMLIDFSLETVETKEGYLEFKITPKL